MKTSVQEERRLLSKCLDGDREASELFVRRFSGLIYHSVRHILLAKGIPFSSEDIEDLHNTIFLNLFENKGRKLGQFKGENGCSLASWLRVVAVRTVLNHLRRKGFDAPAWVRQKVTLEQLTHKEREDLSPLALMEQKERKRVISEAMGHLAPRDHLCVRLLFEQGLPIDEVAEALGISVQNAYTVKHRALQRLRVLLKQT